MDVIGDPREAYGYSPVELNKVLPSAKEITLMDLMLPLISSIPQEKMLIRKIIGHRMLWNTDRDVSIWSYRKLGKKLHCNYKALKRWEEEGVDIITATINKNKTLNEKLRLYVKVELGPYTPYDTRFASELLNI